MLFIGRYQISASYVRNHLWSLLLPRLHLYLHLHAAQYAGFSRARLLSVHRPLSVSLFIIDPLSNMLKTSLLCVRHHFYYFRLLKPEIYFDRSHACSVVSDSTVHNQAQSSSHSKLIAPSEVWHSGIVRERERMSMYTVRV